MNQILKLKVDWLVKNFPDKYLKVGDAKIIPGTRQLFVTEEDAILYRYYEDNLHEYDYLGCNEKNINNWEYDFGASEDHEFALKINEKINKPFCETIEVGEWYVTFDVAGGIWSYEYVNDNSDKSSKFLNKIFRVSEKEKVKQLVEKFTDAETGEFDITGIYEYLRKEY